MKSNVSKKAAHERLVEVEMSEEELAPHFDSAYRKYQKNMRLEGFRKGKVPLGLIKKLYGDAIKSEAIEDVVQSVFMEVSQKENLRPVAPAKLEDVDYIPDEGLKFRAVVEVYPDVELKTYKGLSVERENYEVGEEDVAAALEEVRESMAIMEPVEAGAEPGHYIVADFQQVEAGLPVIGRKFDDRLFQLNPRQSDDELSEQLIGVKPGETRRVKLEISDERSGNKETEKEHYEVHVKEVKAKRLPDVDDELAKDTGNFETLDELKEDIRKTIDRRMQQNTHIRFRNHLIDELLKKNTIEIPEGMVNNYLNRLIQQVKKDSNGDLDEAALREDYRPNVIWNIKWDLAKDKIAELENITVTDEDREKYIKRFAAERGVDEKAYRKSLKTRSAQERFEDNALIEKVLDFLEDNAKIKERKINWKDMQKRKQIAMPT